MYQYVNNLLLEKTQTVQSRYIGVGYFKDLQDFFKPGIRNKVVSSRIEYETERE